MLTGEVFGRTVLGSISLTGSSDWRLYAPGTKTCLPPPLLLRKGPSTPLHRDNDMAPRPLTLSLPVHTCREKRKRAADEMKQKLRSPNFMLSPTRLSLRNLPYTVDEAQLRALAIAAVKERATNEKPRILTVCVCGGGLRVDAGA